MPPILLQAAWVAPMHRPPVRDGGLVLADGVVAAIGRPNELRRTYPAAAPRDFGDAVILPGLVNAHVHLELTHLRRPAAPPKSFADWLLSVQKSDAAESAISAATRAGIAQCHRYGVTSVGEITRDAALTREIQRNATVRGVSFGEIVGMAARRHLLPARLAAATDTRFTTPLLRPGVSPHAPYSVDADGYRQCLAAARGRNLPLTTHLAESPDESPFLSHHAGPFRDLWDRLGAWDDSPPRFTGGPIRYAASLGLLDYPLTLLAHVNYCDDDELAILSRGRASVVYCPRTHAWFGHPPHRWRDMLAAGINVCVGTDSTASSPNLNLVDDLRLLHRIAPEVPPSTLWELATTRAARALSMANGVGTLAPGAPADCAIFPTTGDDPLANLLETNAAPLAVWAGGAPLAP